MATIPVIKFMSYLISHVFFIILLVSTIINPWLPIYKWQNLLPPLHEWVLLLWFCGILATTISNPPDKAGFGAIKLVNLVVGFTAISVHIVGAIFLSAELIPYVLFTRNQLLALVLLLSFVELLNFLTFHHLFGPWAVIIQDLMKDMMRFLVIMGIFLVGFSLTVSAIYVPVFKPLSVPGYEYGSRLHGGGYSSSSAGAAPAPSASAPSTTGDNNHNNQQASQPQTHQQPNTVSHTLLPASQLIGIDTSLSPSTGLEFQSPLFTFEMLFYSLFGLVEPDFMPPMHSSPSISKVIMKLVFGVYMMITVVVLINLLIAMMSNTYQRIEARSDIEWKFGRAKLIRNMIRTSPTPSPLILVMGVWIDYYREWNRRQAAKQKLENLAVSAFNRKARISEAALKAAHIWMSKAPQLNARRQLEKQRLEQRQKRSLSSLRSTSSLQAASGGQLLDAANLTQKLSLTKGVRTSGDDLIATFDTAFRPTLRTASIGHIPEHEIQARKPIHTVVHWPTVVRKYWENIGVVMDREEDTAGGEGSNTNTTADQRAPDTDETNNNGAHAGGRDAMTIIPEYKSKHVAMTGQ